MFAPFASMEFKVWALAIFLLSGSAFADEPKSEASPTPSPSPASPPATMAAEIESPLPDGTPQEQPPTVLLPEPDFLPPPQPPGNETAFTMASAEAKHTPEDESHFKEVKNTAMGSARANHLLKEAKGALSTEARKNFMRAYYYTICAQMRRIDPNLKSMIQTYEAGEIQKIAAEGGNAHAKGKGRGRGGLVSKSSTAKKRHHSYREY